MGVFLGGEAGRGLFRFLWGFFIIESKASLRRMLAPRKLVFLPQKNLHS